MKTTETQIVVSRYNSPAGVLTVASHNGSLCICDWAIGAHHQRNLCKLRKTLHAETSEGTSQVIQLAISQLDEYFAGKRERFDLPLNIAGTEFQNTVWRELLNVPYGETISYAQLARRIGCPTAVRAVANAVGANPISIIIPCHRIVGTNGTLTGYAGSLQAKTHLLTLENKSLLSECVP